MPMAAIAGDHLDDFWIRRKPVLTHFKAEELVYWELVPRLAYSEWWGPPPWANPGSEPVQLGEFGFDEIPLSELTCKAVENMRRAPVGIQDRRMLTENHVAVWSAPTTLSERRGFLNRDRPVTFLERQDQWCHVEYDSGGDGWISCVFLALTPR
jgi:hypothetical protein